MGFPSKSGACFSLTHNTDKTWHIAYIRRNLCRVNHQPWKDDDDNIRIKTIIEKKNHGNSDKLNHVQRFRVLLLFTLGDLLVYQQCGSVTLNINMYFTENREL